MGNVIKLSERNAVQQYSNFYSKKCCNFDLRLDEVIQPRKEKRDIARELTIGYMKLLSNQK